MLHEHLRQARHESAMPWLLLLDPLRREGDRDILLLRDIARQKTLAMAA